MARSIDTIFNELLVAKAAKAELSGLTSTSAVSVWRLLLYVVAVGIWTMEKLFDLHLAEVRGIIASQKRGTVQWYAEMAKLFQFGDALVSDQDYYNNTGLSDATIAAKKVVAFAAATESGSSVRIKVARLNAGDLAPLTAPQLAAFQTYMARIKYAGVFLSFVNSAADALRLELKVYYDPLVIDADGRRIDGRNDTPVQSEIDDYLINKIAFDSYFIPTALVDALQAVDGVKLPVITDSKARYGMLPFADTGDRYLPDSGYLRIAPEDLTITFIPLV